MSVKVILPNIIILLRRLKVELDQINDVSSVYSKVWTRERVKDHTSFRVVPRGSASYSLGNKEAIL